MLSAGVDLTGLRVRSPATKPGERILAQGFEPWSPRLKVGHIAALSRQSGSASFAETFPRDRHELGPINQPALCLLPFFLEAWWTTPGPVAPLDAVLPHVPANDTTL